MTSAAPDPEVEMLAALLASEFEDDIRGTPTRNAVCFLAGASEAIPSEVIDYVRGICRKDWVARRALDLADAKVRRRLRSNSPEARRARWEKRWLSENQEQTKQLLRRYVNVALGRAHREYMAEHAVFEQLPKALYPWRPDQERRLVIDDLRITKPSFGSGAFLEQTPPKLLRWVYETWQDRQTATTRKPRIWDLTAGSGTSIDLLGRVHDCKVVASDLTVVLGDGIQPAHCQHVGEISSHQARRQGPHVPALAIAQPDIVLFDPPSRGRPTHSELYQVEQNQYGGDLADLDRDEYLATVTAVTVWSASALAPGGFVSLLLRCGTRRRGQVTPDPALLEDLKTCLEGHAEVTHEMPLVYRGRRDQTSLGQARVPTVHLVIERAS